MQQQQNKFDVGTALLTVMAVEGREHWNAYSEDVGELFEHIKRLNAKADAAPDMGRLKGGQNFHAMIVKRRIEKRRETLTKKQEGGYLMDKKEVVFATADTRTIQAWKDAYKEAQSDGRLIQLPTNFSLRTTKGIHRLNTFSYWMIDGDMDAVLKKYPDSELKVLLTSESKAFMRVDIGETFVMSQTYPAIALIALLTRQAPMSASLLEVLIEKGGVTFKADECGQPVDVTISKEGERFVCRTTNKFDRAGLITIQ